MARSRIILENDILNWSKVIPDSRKQCLLQNANIHLSIYCSFHKVKPTNFLIRNTSPNPLGYGMLHCMFAFWRRNLFLLSGTPYFSKNAQLYAFSIFYKCEITLNFLIAVKTHVKHSTINHFVYCNIKFRAFDKTFYCECRKKSSFQCFFFF